MTHELDKNWQSLGDVPGKIADRMEEQHRRQFERECEQDGLPQRQPQKTERAA